MLKHTWVCLLDQSLLPQQVVTLRLTHEEQVASAIITLKVRGAPAIGVTAAFGMVSCTAHVFVQVQGANVTIEQDIRSSTSCWASSP